MSKYIDAEKLIAEIERYKQEAAIARFDNAGENADYFQGKVDLCDDLTHIITSHQQEQPDAYDNAMLEVKAYVDKLYDNASIGLNEYDSGLYNGIAETCMKLRGFIKARTSKEQPVLPGIVEDERVGIPGRDFIPVDWVDACEMYGKWKIVKQEQSEVGLEKEIDNVIADYSFTKTIDSGGFKTTVLDYAKIARHFYELGKNSK